MTEAKTREKLIELYQAMYKLTHRECSCVCKVPRSCCSPEYCDMTISHAKDRWGVELVITDHPTLSLMGPEGCIAAPHFRPLCTLHTCDISSLGFKPGDRDWDRKYWFLRDQINELEYKLSRSLAPPRQDTSSAAS